MRQCVEKEWKDKRLNNLSGVAVGLGDHRYDREYNIYAADMLESWIQEHGGNLICPALKINRSPIKTNNQKIIENWAKNFITSLRK
jgi:sulfite reductase alpha subunit-like flavoprotein